MPNESTSPRRTQADRRRVTRDALLAAGRRLFAERGVGAVAAAELVEAAGVTRGALYHHFDDKNDLFRAVFEGIERDLRDEFTARADAAGSAVEGLVTAVGWFLDACERPEVHRICLLDAPAVLGWERWRAIEREHALGALTERIGAAAAEAGAELPGPVDVVASLLFSAVIEAALAIGHAADPAAERARVEPALYELAARTLGLRPG